MIDTDKLEKGWTDKGFFHLKLELSNLAMT